MQNNLKSFAKEIIKDYFQKKQENHRKMAKKPTEIHLSVTENCCLQCKMCDIWKIKDKEKPLDYETGKKIIDVLNKWLGSFNITFAGGEPFLNKDILKIIKYASIKNIKTSTNSNGFIIDSKLAKNICKSGLSTIFFSIDGLEKEHDFIRGRKNTFKNVLNAIKQIQGINSNQKPTIFINSVISNNNLHIITKMVEFTRKLNVKGINFQTLMPNFASIYKSDWWQTNPYWPKDKIKIKHTMNELIMYKKKYGNFILNSQRNLNQFEKYLLNPGLFQKNEKCFVGLNNLMIDTSGNIRLCYEMAKIGNLFEEDPNQIWNSLKAQEIRDQISKCQRPCKLLPCNLSYYENILKRSVNNIKLFIKNK